MKKVKLNELKKAARELNEFLAPDPEIDVKAAQDALISQIIEACNLFEEGEMEELTEATQEVLANLLEKEEADEPDDDRTLQEIVEESDDINELKALVKSEECFKPLRRTVGIQKDIEKLRDKMAEILEEEQTVPEKERKAGKPKREDKPKSKKDKPKKAAGFHRIDSVCLALLDEPETIEEWIEAANDIMIEKGGKANVNETKTLIKFVTKTVEHFAKKIKIPEK